MKIIVIHKSKLEAIPPVISVVNILASLGHEIHLVNCGCSAKLTNMLIKDGVKIYKIKELFISKAKIVKLFNYLFFKHKVSKLLETIYDKNTVLWIEGAQTVVSLVSLLPKYNFVLQISELHENDKIQLKLIKRIIHKSKAVYIPEYNRCAIYQAWFHLNKMPYLLPNKPYYIPDDNYCKAVLNKYKSLIESFKGKKIILYQGGISKTRMLDKIAIAIKTINKDYHLLLVGPEQEQGIIKDLLEITNEITHINFLPSPDYLAFCKISYIGFVFYAPTSLNNIFCAPNKICEYSAYGLPMIGNNIPGLKYIIEKNHAGVIIDTNSIKNLVSGILEIEKNYDEYHNHSWNVYRNVDNREVIRESLNNLNL